MELEQAGAVIEWRGPAPFFFLEFHGENADVINSMSPAVTYGWGVVPVRAIIGSSLFVTSLIPRHGAYLLPIKKAVRESEGISVGSHVSAIITI